MAIAFVQSKNTSTAGTPTSATVVFTSNTTTGNFIAVVSSLNSATTVSSVSISPGSGTFQVAKAQANGNLPVEIWYAMNITGGTTPTVTVTYATNASIPDITIYEFSGVATSSAADGAGSGSTGTSATVTSGSFSTTNANDVLIGGATVANSITLGEASWTAIAPTANGDLAQYIIVSATGSYASTGTQNASGTYTGAVFAFKAAAGTTPLNTTATFLPATILTLVNQLAEKPVVSFLPQTVLTLATSEINNTAVAFSPQTVLTLNAQLIELATVGITPATVLTLAPTIGGNNVNATVGINPGVQMTLNSSSIQSASIGFNPGINSLLMANFFGTTTFPILLPPGNETSNLQQ